MFNKTMNNTTEIHALLISRDAEMSVVFSRMFEEIGVATETCSDESHISDILSQSKFEALVLDFDNIRSALPIICSLREGSSSRDAIVFTVATQVPDRQIALAHGANFAFERPFLLPQIREALQTAYALMLRDRRRYFRCPAENPVRLTRRSGEIVQGLTTNISGNGMAVAAACPLEIGERLEVSFYMSEPDLKIEAVGTVVWDDKHGKSGISFECSSIEVGKRLGAWLDAQFYRRLKMSNARSPGRFS
jgi:CheY-like chemotaxis protein